MEFKPADSNSKTAFTADKEDRVPRNAAALIFHPSGSYELWIPKEDGESDNLHRGAVIATALSVAMETDPEFLKEVLAKLITHIKERAEK